MAIEQYYSKDQQAIPSPRRCVNITCWVLFTASRARSMYCKPRKTATRLPSRIRRALKPPRARSKASATNYASAAIRLTGEVETLNGKLTTLESKNAELAAKRPEDFKKMQRDLDEARTKETQLTEQVSRGRERAAGRFYSLYAQQCH